MGRGGHRGGRGGRGCLTGGWGPATGAGPLLDPGRLKMTRREALEATVWDLYKDVHGMRPRFLDLGKMTEEELFRMIERLKAERS